MEGERRKKNRRGSIFSKLIGSYIIFAVIAIVIAVIVMLVSFFISLGGAVNSDFPGLTILEDGSIGNLDEVKALGGWVEEINEE